MIEKPTRPKQPSIQERQPPRTLQELINRYDLDNTKIYDFLDELVTIINDLSDNKINKSGDTMNGNLNLQNNILKFLTSGSIEWKENGWGDKFRIIPDFNGSGSNNRLIIQSTTGGAGTDPTDWTDLAYIRADTGEMYTGALNLSKTSYNYNNGAIPGTKQATSSTISDLLNELRYTNGQMGSVEIRTAYTLNNITIATGWYNYLYIPHRIGGLNGGANGDNVSFGTLILTGMTVSNCVYVIRYGGSAIVELQKLATQSQIATINTAIADTGWQTATLASGFKAYNGNSANTPQYRRVGKVVEIRGVVSPTSEIAGSDSTVIIFTLPSGYRPSKQLVEIAQGSGRKIWSMSINADGSVRFGRYGSSAYETASTSVWLPFHTTFLVD